MTLRVEVNDVLIAQSNAAILIEEDQQPVRYYFPRSDVDMSKLRRSDTTTRCPFKGVAHYFSLVVDGVTLEDAAWSYEEPYEEHRSLRHRIAFHDERFRELAVVAYA